MRLTAKHKSDFVKAVMSSVPTPATKARADAISDFTKVLERRLPPSILKLSKQYPNVFRRVSGYCPELGEHVYHISMDPTAPLPEAKGADTVMMNYRKELENLRNLRVRLRDLTVACTTLAQLSAALPELTAYMPKDVAKEPKLKNLPVAAGGVVADLLKAGLPVGGKHG